MYNSNALGPFFGILRGRPHGAAHIHGAPDNSAINGTVRFYQTQYGVLVAAEIFGLPTLTKECGSPVFGFHIHSGSTCSGDMSDPFAHAMTHYNPDGCPHPYHAGDMPPLFGANGYAFSVFLSNRFSVKDIIGKTVIIHSKPDDFITQPGGNAGDKIACGEIRALRYS